jgi:hypothetical protein
MAGIDEVTGASEAPTEGKQVETHEAVEAFTTDALGDTPIYGGVPNWAYSLGLTQMIKDLRPLGWEYAGASFTSKERGLVFKAPYPRYDGKLGLSFRVSWKR